MVLRIKPWFARKHNLYSRVLDGEVVTETTKAILFKGSASTAPDEYCHRCGRRIDSPISVVVGYGPVCCEILGIPRLVPQNGEELENLRAAVAEKTKWEGWVPKSVVLETMEGGR
jgi:hypothetical protein